jgi:membrane associated rhomboid family serine protease
MFFPIRTDRRLHRTPWVNYALIAVNIVVFVITKDMLDKPVIEPLILTPVMPRLHQFVTYQFLHGSAMHVIGNMLFLYVFGNSVEDRLGRLAYLGFYLAGGVLAGLGHALIESAPVIGASGAVAAVSGAYLALVPRSRVTVLYWFIIVGAFEVSSVYIIGFYFVYDVVKYLWASESVAYLAHMTGYAFGFAVALSLLLVGLLDREPFDLLALLEHRRRGASYRRLVKEDYQPWEHGAPPRAPARPAFSAGVVDASARRSVAELRSRIAKTLAEQRLADAAALYVKLLALDAGQVLPRQQQLDVANQLAGEGRHEPAARGYELFLQTYPADAQREQVELLLGVLCVRYIKRGQRGRELLNSALTRLTDPAQIRLARQLLEQIDAANQSEI